MPPHATRVVVWDVPSTIECAATFRVKVGVKCAEGCGGAARCIEVRDVDGQTVVAAGVVGDAPWSGTDGLYFAEIELRAPATHGLHTFAAGVADVVDVATGRTTHAAQTARFQVHAVAPPDYLLRVLAVDARSGLPIPGARVVAHPYRLLTDAEGVAELRLPKGAYRLFVSGRERFPFRTDGDLTGDVTIRAELDEDSGPSDAELWS